MAEEGDEPTGPSAEDYDFSSGAAGASHSYPSEAGQIRKGGYIVIKGRPCKVANVSTSKTGKHGHAKCNFTAIDIFTGKKLEDIVPSTHGTFVPNVVRSEFTLVDISDDDFLSLMNDQGDTREDLKVPLFPEDLASEIRTKFEAGEGLVLTVQAAMGEEHVISCKKEVEG